MVTYCTDNHRDFKSIPMAAAVVPYLAHGAWPILPHYLCCCEYHEPNPLNFYQTSVRNCLWLFLEPCLPVKIILLWRLPQETCTQWYNLLECRVAALISVVSRRLRSFIPFTKRLIVIKFNQLFFSFFYFSPILRDVFFCVQFLNRKPNENNQKFATNKKEKSNNIVHFMSIELMTTCFIVNSSHIHQNRKKETTH